MTDLIILSGIGGDGASEGMASNSSAPSFCSFAPCDLEYEDAYRLFTTAVVPRPVAWISTCSANGKVAGGDTRLHNLAPYSFFNAVSGKPAVAIFSIAPKENGEKKDTLRNIEDVKECVIHICSASLLDALSITAAAYEYGVSEFEKAGLSPIKSDIVAPNRIAEALVAMEAKLIKTVEIPGSVYKLVMVEVIKIHVHQSVYCEETRSVLPDKLQPIGRLGRGFYALPGEVVMKLTPSP